MSNNMSISSIKEHYNNLCTKAKEWSAAYYEQDAPVVTDEEYDSVMHEIRDIEAAHPEFVTADSPTQVVGGKRVLGIPVEHLYRCFLCLMCFPMMRSAALWIR